MRTECPVIAVLGVSLRSLSALVVLSQARRYVIRQDGLLDGVASSYQRHTKNVRLWNCQCWAMAVYESAQDSAIHVNRVWCSWDPYYKL